MHLPHRSVSSPIHPHAPRSRRRIVHHILRCSHRIPPSGLSKDRPSVAIATVAPQPTPLARRFGTRCHPCAGSVLVVLRHLDGLRSSRFAGLLHPAHDHEVRRVSAPAVPPLGGRYETSSSALHPPESSLPCSRDRVTAIRCPLVVQAAACDLEALLHTKDRSCATPFPAPHYPSLSWASHPGAISLPLPARPSEEDRLEAVPRFHRRSAEASRLLSRGDIAHCLRPSARPAPRPRRGSCRQTPCRCLSTEPKPDVRGPLPCGQLSLPPRPAEAVPSGGSLVAGLPRRRTSLR